MSSSNTENNEIFIQDCINKQLKEIDFKSINGIQIFTMKNIQTQQNKENSLNKYINIKTEIITQLDKKEKIPKNLKEKIYQSLISIHLDNSLIELIITKSIQIQEIDIIDFILDNLNQNLQEKQVVEILHFVLQMIILEKKVTAQIQLESLKLFTNQVFQKELEHTQIIGLYLLFKILGLSTQQDYQISQTYDLIMLFRNKFKLLCCLKGMSPQHLQGLGEIIYILMIVNSDMIQLPKKQRVNEWLGAIIDANLLTILLNKNLQNLFGKIKQVIFELIDENSCMDQILKLLANKQQTKKMIPQNDYEIEIFNL